MSTKNTLTAAEQEQLREMIAAVGEVEASKQVGIARQTLVRALAGLGLLPGSVLMVRAGLDALRAGSVGAQ
jgi:hypothetical protein